LRNAQPEKSEPLPRDRYRQQKWGTSLDFSGVTRYRLKGFAQFNRRTCAGSKSNMTFYVMDKDGKEQGPVDQETLEKWVGLNKIFPDTRVRNALLSKYKEAGDLDFLKPYFKRQEKEMESQAGYWEKRKIQKQKEERNKAGVQVGTAFRYEYIPCPASLEQRIASTLFDFLLLGICGLVLWCACALLVWMGFEAQTVFEYACFLAITAILLYYGVCLGIFAQTFGMWFWGTLLVKNDLSESFLFRSYVYALLLPLGILTPLTAYLHPNRRGIHELLTGTRIIKIAARPKA
jgi:uncharacterized RDD family membrane protein YckC